MTTTAASLKNTDLWIGGQHTPGALDAIPVLNPSTGEIIASVANADVHQGIEAVDAAAAALSSWRAVPPRERAEVLRRCFEQMSSRADEIAELISTENGKTLADARGETAYAAEFFRWYSEEAVRAKGHISVSPSGTNRILAQYEPIGVAVLVTPWNFPAAMATRKIAPALAAGCTVVLKPATETPLTAYLIAECCRDAGVPEGVVNVLTTRRSGPVVSAMLHDDRVRALSFTGSTEVGRTLLHESADNVLKTSMELGGNAPFLIFEDADLDEAVEGLMVAKMRNGGQACTAANRIYVHRSVADELGRRLAAKMGTLSMGAGTDPTTGCGPLINEAAVIKVDGLVVAAVADGAEILLGATLPGGKGYFYPPTVLANVSGDSRIVKDEIFGPVASIIPFDSDREAIDAANSTVFGLSAYIYTKDLQRGLAIADRIESGMIAINQGLLSDPAAPFGGVKQSGLGREGSQDGMLEFMETKYIATKW